LGCAGEAGGGERDGHKGIAPGGRCEGIAAGVVRLDAGERLGRAEGVVVEEGHQRWKALRGRCEAGDRPDITPWPHVHVLLRKFGAEAICGAVPCKRPRVARRVENPSHIFLLRILLQDLKRTGLLARRPEIS
jgi:hypothetical protein